MTNKTSEVINNVKSQLTGEKEKDKEIILSAMQEYMGNENEEEIIHELSRMLYDCLTPEEIEGFERALRKNIPEITLVDSVREDFNNQNFDDAYNKLDNYIKNESKKFTDTDTTEYHSFDNDFEVVLFDKYIKPEKEVILIPPEVPLVHIYYLYAFLLVERNELDEAEKYLKIANNYNPISTQIISELTDICKRKRNWDDMNKYLESAYNYSYLPEDLARYYRNLGYYHTETGTPDISVALYIHSLKYDNNQLAYQELEYLEHIGQNIEISPEEAKETLAKNNIPLVANPFITTKYREMGDEFTENEEFETALEMYTLAYMLDDNLENQMRYKIAKSYIDGDSEINITL